jgi:hypothetical protein
MTLFTYKDKYGYKQNVFNMLLVAVVTILLLVLSAVVLAVLGSIFQ